LSTICYGLHSIIFYPLFLFRSCPLFLDVYYFISYCKWCYALKSKKGTLVIQYFQNVIASFGRPNILQINNGKEFKNTGLKEYCEKKNIYINGSVRHPQSQGLVERHNRELKEFLWQSYMCMILDIIIYITLVPYLGAIYLNIILCWNKTWDLIVFLIVDRLAIWPTALLRCWTTRIFQTRRLLSCLSRFSEFLSLYKTNQKNEI